MRTYKIGLGVMVDTLLIAQFAVAQGPPPSQYEKVKALEAFIGEWSGEAQPPGAPKGIAHLSCKWAANKSYVQQQWRFAVEGNTLDVATGLWGWDGTTQQLHAWAFSMDGRGQGPLSVDGNKVTMKGSRISPTGEKGGGVGIYHLDGDKLTMKETERYQGDETQPDWSMTLTRKK